MDGSGVQVVFGNGMRLFVGFKPIMSCSPAGRETIQLLRHTQLLAARYDDTARALELCGLRHQAGNQVKDSINIKESLRSSGTFVGFPPTGSCIVIDSMHL